jgi:hypothetical protein
MKPAATVTLFKVRECMRPFGIFAIIALLCSWNESKCALEPVVFDGKIDKRSSLDLIRKLNSRGQEIIITSAGGNIESAIDIAVRIRQLNISVAVKDYCFSACASYILPAAHKVILMPGSIV